MLGQGQDQAEPSNNKQVAFVCTNWGICRQLTELELADIFGG